MDRYEDGRQAHADGKARHENPHAINTEEWALWMDGFDQAASEAAFPMNRAAHGAPRTAG